MLDFQYVNPVLSLCIRLRIELPSKTLPGPVKARSMSVIVKPY